MEILNQLANSMSSYFNALKQFGYKNQKDVNKLLAYNFIGELLTGDMRVFINEEDYRTIEQALSCMYGSNCLIPYPQYVNDDYLFGVLIDNELRYTRLSESENIRHLEKNNLRFKAYT